MMYMLDTNAIIMTARHPDWEISRKIRLRFGHDLCISTVVYAELEYGIRKSAFPQKNRFAINTVISGVRIVDFDIRAAEHFGDIFADLERKRQRIGDRDMMIAAHARSLGYTLVTNNMREFSRVDGLLCEDWK